MKILDLTAGRRSIWFNKFHPLVTFLDHRAEVEPTILCDSGAIPAEAGVGYDLIVFDPPHTNIGKNGQMSSRYGSSTQAEIRKLVSACAREAFRVAKPEALMAFKWSNHGHISLEEVLSLMPGWEPLFGQKVSIRTKHASATWWTLLKRKTQCL